MKSKAYILLILIAFVLTIGGCSSSEEEEIVQSTDTVEIKSDIQNQNQTTGEKDTYKPVENKFSDKQVIVQKFVIQVAAFSDIAKADEFADLIRTKLSGQNVVIKDIDSFFKILVGNYSSKDEALKYQNELMEAGFNGSFIIVHNSLKLENK